MGKYKNIQFWDGIAQRTPPAMAEYAGMLMQGRDFEVADRCKGEQKRFLSIAPRLDGKRVLEVGCGGGRWASFLSPRVESYLGIDLSPKMIGLAQAVASKSELVNVQFRCADIRELESSEFDLIYFSGVLQYLSDTDLRETLRAACRLLKDSGLFISRDSVQTLHRLELAGDYPVIYRLEHEYENFFAEIGFSKTYSALSYSQLRFTKTAGRVFRITGSYRVAAGIRRLLCWLDRLLGNPAILKRAKLKQELNSQEVRQHRFFRYEKRSSVE